MAPLLEMKSVSKTFTPGVSSRAPTHALQDISLEVDEARPTILSVAGESGSGKTTLAMLLLGFIQPTSGEILYRGRRIADLRGADRLAFRREVQAVFQDPYAVFNPFYTVDHLLSVPIRYFGLARTSREAHGLMAEALTAVGLHPDEILGRFPHQLSGGQRQRVNVARALLLRPRLLIADEPVSMVDASLRANILEALSRLHQQHGVSILYITHDLATAYHLAQSIIVLYRGAVMEAGGVDALIKRPQHPYTRLLVDSIPWPSIDNRWGALELTERAAEPGPSGAGCQFLSRCPAAMDQCRQPPPLFRMNQDQAAACFLYDQYPALEAQQVGGVLSGV
jgi:peptide/nickel transport system ATP-binding protein